MREIRRKNPDILHLTPFECEATGPRQSQDRGAGSWELILGAGAGAGKIP
jgi:hypothetical protein